MQSQKDPLTHGDLKYEFLTIKIFLFMEFTRFVAKQNFDRV